MSKGGMIFLESESRIVRNVLERIFDPEVPDCFQDVHVGEFDDVKLWVYVPEEDKDTVYVSLKMNSFADVSSAGAQAVLAEEFPGMQIEPNEGYDLTLFFDRRQLPMPQEELISKIADLKSIVFGAPFVTAFRALAAGTSGGLEARELRYRTDETVYIVPREDRIAVVFAEQFEDDMDRAIARIMAQEFVESRRHVSHAPPVLFTAEPPMELEGRRHGLEEGKVVGYVSFSILPGLVTEEKLKHTAALLCTYRVFSHYHIKAAKSYLHARMRARVNGWLQVLNRAKPEDPFASGEKKLASGRTFHRR
jgi:actin related protein 2/3 complex subunit 2